MGPIGIPELAIVLVIVVIIFGVGKLPEVGSSLGKGIRQFKAESSGTPDRDSTTPTAELGSTQLPIIEPALGGRHETTHTDRRSVRADDI